MLSSSAIKRYLAHFCNKCLKPILTREYRHTTGFYSCKHCARSTESCKFTAAFQRVILDKQDGCCGRYVSDIYY